jgi:hypothetical protein
MSTSDKADHPAGDGQPASDEPQRSGEGAQTALQALIRKRKLADNPQDPPEPQAQSPQPPAQS